MKLPLKFRSVILLPILIAFLSVSRSVPNGKSWCFCLPVLFAAQTGVPHKTNQPETIKVANFNIQVFGKNKAGKWEVMAIIARIITNFDIVAIQEIRDKSGTAIKKLENEVDALGSDYYYVIGPRLGRTVSKEQYAYMYKTDTISQVSDNMVYTYDDSAHDLFHRDPLIARFKAKNGTFDFVLITIHTDPDEATKEIDALSTVVKDAQEHFPDEDDYIILGDLNADCIYFDENNKRSPLRSQVFKWLVANDMDTNLAKSACTYDRIIITTDTTSEAYTGQSGVYTFDVVFSLSPQKAKQVSDHYPVWSTFYIGKNYHSKPSVESKASLGIKNNKENGYNKTPPKKEVPPLSDVVVTAFYKLPFKGHV